MNPFTDDKRDCFKRQAEQLPRVTITSGVLHALFARLEAAEKCIEVTFDVVPELIDLASYQAWRKAAGK